MGFFVVGGLGFLAGRRLSNSWKSVDVTPSLERVGTAPAPAVGLTLRWKVP